MQYGASFEEVVEAAFLAGLPAGMPAFEGFCRAMQEMREGKGWVPQDSAASGEAKEGGKS
jgi:hypothetical protein